MDPITLILTALAGGAASGLQDSASSAMDSEHASLKASARRHLPDGPAGDLVLTEYESAPDAWKRPLGAQAEAADADQNAELVRVAQALMGLVDEAGSRTGKYAIDVRGSTLRPAAKSLR
jgi:hypothetical protein